MSQLIGRIIVAVAVLLSFNNAVDAADDIDWKQSYPKYEEAVPGVPSTKGIHMVAKGTVTGQNKMQFEYRKKGDTTWIKTSDIMANTDGEYDSAIQPAGGTWEVRPVIVKPNNGGYEKEGPIKKVVVPEKKKEEKELSLGD
jgi:hypothetical protein